MLRTAAYVRNLSDMCDVYITAYVRGQRRYHIRTITSSIYLSRHKGNGRRPDEWHDAGAEGDEFIHLTYDEQCFFFQAYDEQSFH